MIDRIEIKKEFGFNELERRLKQVRLRGFPDVRIYEDANIDIQTAHPTLVRNQIFTPQPTIFRKGFLDRIDHVAKLFTEKGIDIFRLNGGVDYAAFDNGQSTDWTIVPPPIEMISVGFDEQGLDYTEQLSEELMYSLGENGQDLNPELKNLNFSEYERFSGVQKVPIICDGSHRIHLGLEKNISQNLIVIDSPKKGYPYYAAPKPYSAVRVENERPEFGATTKTHVITEPGHKLLYRLFPTGDILCGVVRPEKTD